MDDAWSHQLAEAMVRKIREAVHGDPSSWHPVPGLPVRVDFVSGPEDLQKAMPAVLVEVRDIDSAAHAAPETWHDQVEVKAWCLLKAGPEAHRAVHNLGERVAMIFRAQVRRLESGGESLIATGSFFYSGRETMIDREGGMAGYALAVVKGTARRRYSDGA